MARSAEREEELDAELDVSGVVPSGEGDRRRLQSGELSIEAYLDLQVERALAQLQGVLDAERLETMRQILRVQLEADPSLAELVERAVADE